MNIAIIESDTIEQEKVHGLLDKYFLGLGIKNEYNLYTEEEAVSKVLLNSFDMVFLQINGFSNGVETAKILRDNNYKGKIFITAQNGDFALESYDIYASGYIVKPINYNKIKKALDRYSDRYKTEFYKIKQKNIMLNIPFDDIIFFESDNTKCYINCINNKRYTIYKQLRHIEKELDDIRFLRCHQSFIVNMNHIADTGDVFTLKNGDEILIRQREKSLMINKYYKYLIDKSI